MKGGFTLYTLQGLAKKEGVSYGYLRVMLARLRKAEKPLQWRNYQFITAGEGFIVATEKDTQVEVVD